MRRKTKLKRFSIFFVLLCFLIPSDTSSRSISERFNGKEKLTYKIYFNGLPSGKIEWQHLGKTNVNGKEAELLSLTSETSILKLLNLASQEKVFLDSTTHLPLKVERDVKLFGKKEVIRELYDQEKGVVKIVKTNSKREDTIIHGDRPLHNILALLYFFPQDAALTRGESFSYNLPTQKVKIEVLAEKTLTNGVGKHQVYHLKGKGARKFHLWLDKEDRTPLRIDFPLLIGKVRIMRID